MQIVFGFMTIFWSVTLFLSITLYVWDKLKTAKEDAREVEIMTESEELLEASYSAD